MQIKKKKRIRRGNVKKTTHKLTNVNINKTKDLYYNNRSQKHHKKTVT